METPTASSTVSTTFDGIQGWLIFSMHPLTPTMNWSAGQHPNSSHTVFLASRKPSSARISMKQDNKLSVLDNIHARTSIRSYQPKEVEDEKIEQLLRAAMAAPTATNRQPWAFIVIRDKETMNELGSTLPYAKMVKDAPLAIAVCGDLTKAISGAGIEYWVQDASAASENLLLAAQALGLGAVWTGVYPIDERVKKKYRKYSNYPNRLFL